MSTHPVIRSLHNVGLAAWTGGSLMGAIGLNGAAAALDDPAQRSKAATAGWSRWATVNAAAIGSHLVGAAGLLVTDWPRVRHQQGVGRSSAVKTATTGVGLGVAVWSAVLNRRMAKAGAVPVAGATEAALSTPRHPAIIGRQARSTWETRPSTTAALMVRRRGRRSGSVGRGLGGVVSTGTSRVPRWGWRGGSRSACSGVGGPPGR